MVSNVDMQKEYVNLYKRLRKYLWDYRFISSFVDFEDSLLCRFPDMKSVRRNLNDLYLMSTYCRRSDEDLEDAFKKFKNLVDNNECDFSYIVVNFKE